MPKSKVSTSSSLIESVAPRSNERKRAYAAIEEISETTKRIALEMEASNKDSFRLHDEHFRIQINEEVKFKRRNQRIEIAKSLGNTDELNKIMQEIRDEQEGSEEVNCISTLTSQPSQN